MTYKVSGNLETDTICISELLYACKSDIEMLVIRIVEIANAWLLASAYYRIKWN
jgi:hypothetical protein